MESELQAQRLRQAREFAKLSGSEQFAALAAEKMKEAEERVRKAKEGILQRGSEVKQTVTHHVKGNVLKAKLTVLQARVRIKKAVREAKRTRKKFNGK